MNREIMIMMQISSEKCREMIEDGFEPERIQEMINLCSNLRDPIAAAASIEAGLKTMQVLEKHGDRVLLGRELNENLSIMEMAMFRASQITASENQQA